MGRAMKAQYGLLRWGGPWHRLDEQYTYCGVWLDAGRRIVFRHYGSRYPPTQQRCKKCRRKQ